MQDLNTHVPSSLSVPAVRFDVNKEFQYRNLSHDRDSSIARLQRKSWIRSSNERRSNREALTTLLSSHGENSNDCIEKLLAEEISYRDLASLSSSDLELMGFKDPNERQELMIFFSELPNQDPTYKDICGLPEAKEYNCEILGKAIDHFDNMRSALSATNYKLKILPPDDIIVGEKSFASRFVLESLAELKAVTYEIDKEIDDLVKLQMDKDSKQSPDTNIKKYSYSYFGIWAFICTMAAAGALASSYIPNIIRK
ncbi:uncharacterized protein LOC105209658 isoform X1 [Zeugodacus cucurbitae]|uniref:uncharacterized protein LOC105209658 isoform X1 n=1 Tax=Zeugodacus cucurbitae TaxID=28588 RepID=UPI000596A18E|nr:uncharacterized protein LOC105209658 isoform X1 [Zeugodacus cucurbitae]